MILRSRKSLIVLFHIYSNNTEHSVHDRPAGTIYNYVKAYGNIVTTSIFPCLRGGEG